MDKDEALKLALEALNTPRPTDSYPPLWRSYEKTINDAITALKQALAADVQEPVATLFGSLPVYDTPPVQEPVAWMTQARNFVHVMEFTEAEAKLYGWIPVYTTPPAQQAPNCTRSHPHESMDAMCELRTEIARLTNENARLKAQPAPVQDSTCRETLRAQGKAYPRTCKKCGKGTCIGAPVAPVQEPVAWRWVNPKGWLTYGEAPHDTFKSTPLYTAPPAARPAIPDAMTSADIQEHIEYVAGWNDCRAAMLEMMK